MIGITFIYLIAVIMAVSIAGYFLRAKKRNILIGISSAAFGIPFTVFLVIFALKGSIQQGKILEETMLGPLLNIVAPPIDLYITLAETNLKPGTMEYTLEFSHKYVGKYALTVSSPKPQKEENPKYDDISFTLTILEGGTDIFKVSNPPPGQFWGHNDYGAFLVWYKVPGDLPISRALIAEVNITGDLKGFLDRRGRTSIKLKKVSDE